MAHYVCADGCRGVAEKPKVCETVGCPREGKDLLECECLDGSHRTAVIREESKEEANPLEN